MARCETCRKEVSDGERFCTRCGEKQSARASAGGTRVYGDDETKLLVSARVRVPVLVRVGAEGEPPLEAWLKAGAFVIGRSQGDWVFPDDSLLSSRHAALEAAAAEAPQDGVPPWTVTVADLSKNGIFVRARGPVKVDGGLCCLIGGTLLEWERPMTRAPVSEVGKSGHTVALKRGKSAALFKISISGPEGETTASVSGPATIGGRGAQIELDDPWVSEHHADLTTREGQFFLEDRDSRNGLFVRLGKDKTPLANGDELRIGGQLLRFELRER